MIRINAIQIRPCPFCGAPAKIWEWNGGVRVDCSGWRVTDGAEHYVGIGAKTYDEAIMLWNGERLCEDVPMEYLEAGGTL